MLSILKLVLGFVLLVWGANKFVMGASSLACKLGVSSLIIGLTIVAFGTSAPELAVSVAAGINGENEIALGNILGSNIFNLMVVTGMSALIAPLVAEKMLLKRDWIASILATIALLTCILFDAHISRIDAIILLVGFIMITTMQIKSAKKDAEVTEPLPSLPQELPSVQQKYSLTVLTLLFGLVLIVLGGEITVSGATEIAKIFGLSDTLIGLTIVAIGTSLPELVTSLVATKKGEYSIAIGNVIGSNIFNILLILGVTSLLNPITIQITAIYDTLLLLAVTVLMFILAKKDRLTKHWGLLLVSLYGVYTIWLIVR